MHNKPVAALAAIALITTHAALNPANAAQDNSMAESNNARAVNLAPNLEPAEPLTYRLEIESRETVEVLGQEQVGLATAMTATIAVQTTDPANLDLGPDQDTPHAAARVRFTTLTVDLAGSPLANGTFESDTPAADEDPADPIAAAARSILDKDITLHLAADGTIESVQGLRNLAPADTPALLLFDRLFGEQALKSMLQPLFRIKDGTEDSPARANFGDSWTLTTPPVNSLGLPPAELNLTLHEPTDQQQRQGNHRISIEGTTEPEVPESARSLDPEVTKRDIKGQAIWSTRLGRLRSLTTEADQQMRAEGAFTVVVNSQSNTRLRLQSSD